MQTNDNVAVKCFVKRDVHDRYRQFCNERGMSVNAWTKALVLVTVGDLDASALDLEASKLEALVRGK